MDSTSDHRQRDYLQGYLVLKGALSECDLAAMNRCSICKAIWY